ncbi:hypothetical protein AB0I81_35210 [Nonomuraea sp. NPDC050404]|uniref:hypothetical protein n=1 Tax=Nonomuraea sp. NPDC050404 TaxID=3155783 RepID=UPI0033C5DA9C
MKLRTLLGLIAGIFAMAFVLAPTGTASATVTKADPGASVVSKSETEGTRTHNDAVASKTKSSDRSAAAAGQVVPFAASCYNGWTSGRNFYMTCTSDSTGYRVYVDCSNGVRYRFTGTRYYGTWNHTLTCPVGTNAVWGGWFQ